MAFTINEKPAVLEDMLHHILKSHAEKITLTERQEVQVIKSDGFELLVEDMLIQLSEDYEIAARPLIKHLCEKHNAHTSAIVTTNSVQVVQGVSSSPELNDYIKD